jgi:hypothetical protein
MAFPYFLIVRYQNYTGKAIFMPLSIGAGIGVLYKSKLFYK